MRYLLEGQQSERLKFRCLNEADFNWWLEFCTDPESTVFMNILGTLEPEAFCKAWFEKVFDRYQNNTGGHNVLIEKATGLRVGMSGLLVQEVDGKEELEVGYSLHPAFTGKGFATEAARKCRDFAFENNFTQSLISIIHTENLKSAKVALRNGMKPEKTTVYKEIPVNIFRIQNHEIICKI